MARKRKAATAAATADDLAVIGWKPDPGIEGNLIDPETGMTHPLAIALLKQNERQAQ